MKERDFEKQLTLLQEECNKIEEWLKEAGVSGECMGAGFEPIDGHQGRVMDFEYIGNVEYLDTNALAASIAEDAIDDRFSVRVFTYGEDAGEEYKNLFCVEVWLDEYMVNI